MENATETMPLTIEDRLARLEEKMDVFIGLATDIKNAIEPTLESLKNSPIGKMFL